MSEPSTSLRLADGTLISTTTGKRTVSTDINKAFSDGTKNATKSSDDYEGSVRRYLDDLPVPAPQSKAIAIVSAYTIFGLSEADIAFLLKVSVEQITDILHSHEYGMFVDGMLQNIREHDTSSVRKSLNEAAQVASNRMVRLVSSNKEAVAYAAAKDILDRTGHKAADVVQHNHKFDGITIRVIDDTNDTKKQVDVEI